MIYSTNQAVMYNLQASSLVSDDTG